MPDLHNARRADASSPRRPARLIPFVRARWQATTAPAGRPPAQTGSARSARLDRLPDGRDGEINLVIMICSRRFALPPKRAGTCKLASRRHATDGRPASRPSEIRPQVSEAATNQTRSRVCATFAAVSKHAGGLPAGRRPALAGFQTRTRSGAGGRAARQWPRWLALLAGGRGCCCCCCCAASGLISGGPCYGPKREPPIGQRVKRAAI